ncbi:MAG: hypothetical protein WA139_02245 [Candidatus Aenigmatarchaeota archaeon]
METGELSFEEIERAVKNRERTKIHTIDDGRNRTPSGVFLKTGFVKETFETEMNAKSVRLQPAVFFHVKSYDSPIKQEVEALIEGYISTSSPNELSKIYSVTTSYDEHVSKSTPLIKQICGEETKAFKDYLRQARYL